MSRPAPKGAGRAKLICWVYRPILRGRSKEDGCTCLIPVCVDRYVRAGAVGMFARGKAYLARSKGQRAMCHVVGGRSRVLW